MHKLWARYRKVTGFAHSPTLKGRVIAAIVAAGIAFAAIYFLFDIGWNAGSKAIWIGATAGGLAAGYAAATTRWALAATYGVLAVVWVMLEGVALLFGVLAAGIG